MASLTGYVGSGYPAPGFRNPLRPPRAKAPVIPGAIDNPDAAGYYGGILTSDPRYTGAEAGLTATLGHAGSSRAEQIRQALIKYGVTGNITDPYGDVDPTTLAAAQSNPESIFNQLKNAYQHNLSTTHNNLEQRGILQSGARTQADNQLGANYATDNYNATNDLNALVTQALAGYQNASDTYGTEHANLINTVTGILQNDPSIAPAPKAHLVAGSQQRYGQPIYSDANGKLYTRAGKPFTAQSGPARPGLTFGGI